MDIDKMINYTQRILRGTMFNKYKQVMAVCNDLEKVLAGDQWTLVETKDVNMKSYGIGPRWALLTDWVICTWDLMGEKTFRNSYISIW